ncbi:MFS-type transporter SLC18B1 isoform X1 [Lepeophtheirus salmonis]|uniref:MFS-type transporter SLC18B1 isoform X1 n=1 Tax=Lepeophtheirus salmonis TaxID=72036 RepID=UPI001AE25FA1|nr:MFS-type transporter SLC18B1-like [Lepeophtheirus salmonis]
MDNIVPRSPSLVSASTSSSSGYSSEDVNDNHPGSRKRKKSEWTLQTWSNLIVFAVSEVLGGITYSLLSPFYTQEAQSKGMTVSETGMVYSVAFITTIIFAPIFGKHISRIGSKQLFIGGTFLAGTTNILFGLLEWVYDRTSFFALSMAIRIVTATGEAAFFSSIYPLAAQAVDVSSRSIVLSVMETMFGIGLMIGPLIGGLLYELGGFCLPFVISGSILFICSIISSHILSVKYTNQSHQGRDSSKAFKESSFTELLKIPSIFLTNLVLCCTSMSVSWYLPSLQPFLVKKFDMGPVAVGIMFMLDGATYAVFSPIWGYLLSRGLKPIVALSVGCCCIIVGYSFLGPLPLLPFIPDSIYFVGMGLLIHGCGTAANFITTLTFMMSKSVESGASDSEQTRSMITSLWFINECVGGYIGSSLGGIIYDKIGFEWGTLIIETTMIINLFVIVPILHHQNLIKTSKFDDEDRRVLLPPSQNNSSQIKYTIMKA